MALPPLSIGCFEVGQKSAFIKFSESHPQHHHPHSSATFNLLPLGDEPLSARANGTNGAAGGGGGGVAADFFKLDTNSAMGDLTSGSQVCGQPCTPRAPCVVVFLMKRKKYSGCRVHSCAFFFSVLLSRRLKIHSFRQHHTAPRQRALPSGCRRRNVPRPRASSGFNSVSSPSFILSSRHHTARQRGTDLGRGFCQDADSEQPHCRVCDHRS